MVENLDAALPPVLVFPRIFGHLPTHGSGRRDAVRIISGSAKGKKLASFSGLQIRPTADRVRESIFNILFSRIGSCWGKSVLDLYAGTGAMALEALSRGARRAVLIDQGKEAAHLIPANLRACHLEQKADFMRANVLEALPRLKPEAFDLIFVDPPYDDRGLAGATVADLARLELLAAGGVLCLETARDEEIPGEIGKFERCQLRSYGGTAVHIFTHPKPEA